MAGVVEGRESRRLREGIVMDQRSETSGLAVRDEGDAVLQVAERLHAMSPEWVVFFREVLGVDGIVRRTFREPEALARFECSPQHGRIKELLDDLRARQRDRPAEREAQRVVTVRMPRSLHETLKAEADRHRVSINTLCISKLLKLLDDDGRRDLAVGAERAG